MSGESEGRNPRPAPVLVIEEDRRLMARTPIPPSLAMWVMGEAGFDSPPVVF